jgi:hypothetical protein
MAANGTVVDELVVRLRLDTTEYKKADKDADKEISKTEKKRAGEDDKRKKRQEGDIKRTKEATAATKGWALALRGLGVVAGAAALAVTGSFGAMTMLAGFETNLRRAAVSTNMSNREMQAWGSTARRLGADAQAGAQAIADLAREQQQFNITGQGPTLQALARLGVNAGPNTSIADMLGQAQQIYRQSSPAQQAQIEAGLAAQGVSNDLIVMIKSETDAREAYTKSFAESANENRKALDAVTEALTSMGNSTINIANSLATIAQPAVEQFAKWVSDSAISLSAWNDRVVAAGSGLTGLVAVLSEDFPRATDAVTRGLRVLGEVVDVVAFGFQKLRDWFANSPGLQKEIEQMGKDLSKFGGWISEKWQGLVGKARSEGPAPVQNWLNSQTPTAGQSAPRGVSSAQDIMTKLVTKYGMNVDQAAAVAANIGGESNFNPAAFNPAGGGQGARGLTQLRGARIDAFKKKYGILPDQATVDQQLEFMMTDPYERSLVTRSLANGGATDMGVAFSKIFEAHGNAAVDAARGRTAAQYAQAYNGPAAGAPVGQGAPQISINGPVTVQANNPGEFIGGIQRIAGPQNYNSATR